MTRASFGILADGGGGQRPALLHRAGQVEGVAPASGGSAGKVGVQSQHAQHYKAPPRGATVGQLNDEAIFYLRSRGIGFDKARRMLIHAFADEVLERIRFTPVREHLDRLIWDQIERLPDSAEAAS